MVRQTLLFLFGLAFFTLFTSCEEPIDSGILPFVEPKLVVQSNFTEGRAIIVTVSRSRLIGDVGPEEYLIDAEVDLFWNGSLLERLSLVIPNDPEQPPYFRTWENTPVTDLEYSIRVSVPGYRTVMASSYVPPSVRITEFKLNQLRSEPVQNGEALRNYLSALVDFDDPVSSVNYYHLNITQQINNFVLEGQDTLITKSFLKPVLFNPLGNRNDIMANLKGGLLFEDKPEKKALAVSFSVDINPLNQMLGKTYVELRTLSREYYLFYTTLSASEGGNQNPLTDPVIVYENVENGHGIFAGYSNSLDSVQVVN